MNTHATNLLTQLIDGLMNAKPTTELHAHQMQAVELKGALGITPMMTLDAETGKVTPTPWGDHLNANCPESLSRSRKAEIAQKPTPDADGWVENTSGKRPCGKIAQVKFRGGHIGIDYASYEWEITGLNSDITHYRPA